MKENLLIKILETDSRNISGNHLVVKHIEKIIKLGCKEYYHLRNKPDSNPRKKFYSQYIQNNILKLAKIGPKYKAITYAHMFNMLYKSDYISKLF